MSTVELTQESLDAAESALAGKGPINMVNLLRYRAEADYGDRTDVAPCSGKEAYYARYIGAFSRLPGAERTSITWIGNVHATLVAPERETWHDIAIVEYPSFEAFRAIVESREYKEQADPHRLAALEDWRFIATTKANLPG